MCRKVWIDSMGNYDGVASNVTYSNNAAVFDNDSTAHISANVQIGSAFTWCGLFKADDISKVQ